MHVKNAWRGFILVFGAACSSSAATRDEPFRDTVRVTTATLQSSPEFRIRTSAPACAGDTSCRGVQLVGTDGRRIAAIRSDGRLLLWGAHDPVVEVAPPESLRPRRVVAIRPDGDGVTYIDDGGLRLVHAGRHGAWARRLPWVNTSRGVRLGIAGVSVLNTPPARQVGDPVVGQLSVVEWDRSPAGGATPSHRERSVAVAARATATSKSDLEPLRPLFFTGPEWVLDGGGRVVWVSSRGPQIAVYGARGRPETLIELPGVTAVPIPRAIIDSAAAVLRGAASAIPDPRLRTRFAKEAERSIRQAENHYPLVAALVPLGDGGFLAQAPGRSSREQLEWLAFDARGTLQGRLPLPGTARILGGTRDTLLIESHGEAGRTIHWYEVARPAPETAAAGCGARGPDPRARGCSLE